MKQLQLKKIALLISFIFLSCLISASPDSLIYRVVQGHNITVNFNGHMSESIKLGRDISEFTLYKPGDEYKRAIINYNDSDWKAIDPELDTLSEVNDSVGVVWLRLHFKIDEKILHKTICIKIQQLGASEIFIDGKLMKMYGIVSADPALEVCENPKNDIIGFTLGDTLEHLVAIRYSNAHYKNTYTKYDSDSPGLTISILDFNSQYSETKYVNTLVAISCSSLFAFFFALSLVHFLIYYFERAGKFNLYHSVFVGIFGVIFLLPLFYQNSSDPVFTTKLKYYAEYLTPVFFISLLALLYNLFKKPLNRFFYICLIADIILILSRFFSETFFDASSTFVYMTIYVGSTVIAIKAIYHKLPGAKIVGWGVLSFTMCIIAALIVLIIAGLTKSTNDITGFIVIALAVLALLSLPLSMSVYLAVDFARANKTLKQQIIQIEDLSTQTIKQEQEKKIFLENQNKVLEQQVEERTGEILTKNLILEDQKKEITDSITYASRIQQAILPDIAEIKKILPDSFVLFKPKDIVSGDFYYFQPSPLSMHGEEAGVRSLFIAAVDCTGHGVPGAFMSMLGKESLDKAISIADKPSEILSLLNKNVKQSLKQDNSKDATRDGMDIAFCRIIPANEKSEVKLQFSGANRPIWIIRKNTNIVEEIKATKTAIGGLTPNEQIFEQHELILKKGDAIYLSSDGYADQFSPEDKKLMTRKFKEILSLICDKPMDEQHKYLADFHKSWKGSMEQTDDVLVIGIRV